LGWGGVHAWKELSQFPSLNIGVHVYFARMWVVQVLQPHPVLSVQPHLRLTQPLLRKVTHSIHLTNTKTQLTNSCQTYNLRWGS
jgi:hypothetical protein